MFVKRLGVVVGVVLLLAVFTACQGSIDDVIGGFNARATQVAGGGTPVIGQQTPVVEPTSLPTETPMPSAPVVLRA